MVNHRRRRGQAAKLQPKFVGSYVVVEAMPNHTYKIESSGQVSIQNEVCLKPYWASPDVVGEAPSPLLEPRRQTTTHGIDPSMRWSCHEKKAWQETSDHFHRQKYVPRLQHPT